jgi:hypothetical protein
VYDPILWPTETGRDNQFLQQYTPPCPEHVPDPVEHEYVLSSQIASGVPSTLFAHDAVDGNVA